MKGRSVYISATRKSSEHSLPNQPSHVSISVLSERGWGSRLWEGANRCSDYEGLLDKVELSGDIFNRGLLEVAVGIRNQGRWGSSIWREAKGYYSL